VIRKAKLNRKKTKLSFYYWLFLILLFNINLSCLAQESSTQAKQKEANNKKSSSNNMIFLFGTVVIVVAGGIIFITSNKNKKEKTNIKSSIKKIEPSNKAKIVTSPIVPPVANTPPVTPTVPPVVNTPPVTPTVPPVANTPPVNPLSSFESDSNKKLFDSKQLDNDLDSLFSDSTQVKKETKEEKKPLFDAAQLDNDLDALFVEANKIETTKEEKKGLFDSKQLDNDLDSLFTESTPLSSQDKPSFEQKTSSNDDLSSLFSMSTPLSKEEDKTKQSSSGTFDLDSLDFLSSESDKKEPKKEEAFQMPSSLDLSSLVSSEQPKKQEEKKSNIDLTTTTVGLNISDYLSSISTEKKEENKKTEFSLTSTIPPQSLNLSDLLGQSPVSEKVISQEKDKKDGSISIGKMNIQQSALDEIIKKAEKAGKAGLTTTQVITAVKGKSLDTLLVDINNIDGILGSIIVGKDGLVIANTLPENIDKDLIGALTSSLFSNIDVQTKKLGKGNLKRLTVQTDLGIFILTEIEMGTLVVLSKDNSKPNLSETFRAIASVTGKR